MTDDELSLTLFCAFRYALGSMSFITSDVSQILIKYNDRMDVYTKNKIKEEIREAIKEDKAGMPIDVFEWGKVLEKI